MVKAQASPLKLKPNIIACPLAEKVYVAYGQPEKSGPPPAVKGVASFQLVGGNQLAPSKDLHINWEKERGLDELPTILALTLQVPTQGGGGGVGVGAGVLVGVGVAVAPGGGVLVGPPGGGVAVGAGVLVGVAVGPPGVGVGPGVEVGPVTHSGAPLGAIWQVVLAGHVTVLPQ